VAGSVAGRNFAGANRGPCEEACSAMTPLAITSPQSTLVQEKNVRQFNPGCSHAGRD
jgi:hypothetical protein